MLMILDETEASMIQLFIQLYQPILTIFKNSDNHYKILTAFVENTVRNARNKRIFYAIQSMKCSLVN